MEWLQLCGELSYSTLKDHTLIIYRSISDIDGPKITETFYENIIKSSTNGSELDTMQAARALHLAVAKLRSEKVSFERWVPFIYLGK